jgi:acyl dehydratase
VKTEAIGKSYPSVEYEVGKEKIGEYARAVGEENPVYFDRAAAKEAGFRDVVAPPMFAVVYSWGAVALPAVDPERCSSTVARRSPGTSRSAQAT